MKRDIGYILILISMLSCIGTDIVDSEIVEESIVVTPDSGSLIIGEDLQLDGVYTNMFGILTEVQFDWRIEDKNILSVDANGLVRSIGSGQTIVTANFESTRSNDVLITVVSNSDEIASVIIAQPSKTVLQENETLQLSAAAYNIGNEELEDKAITWNSSNTEVMSVTETGLITAVGQGSAMITATSETVRSEPLSLTVGTGLVMRHLAE